MINPDAFFAEDPPPMLCLEDGTRTTPDEEDAPGGTPECPDDKNREGCPCREIGETAPCWPGERRHRDRGVCTDGTTTCMAVDEFWGVWGPCEGAVLPTPGVERGPEACGCFSAGTWELDCLSPCFVDYGSRGVYAVSTYIDGPSSAACPRDPGGPPPRPQPGETWTTNRLQIDCAGRFELCYTIRAGDVETASASDCVVAESCVETWYEEAGVVQELPPLPSWVGTDTACARSFRDSGGYGEMSVVGLSLHCEEIGSEGDPVVFNRVPYCPLHCTERPSAPECERCRVGGSGSF